MGWHRMVAFSGAGLGTVYGGVIGNWLGWRWVFLLVIVPGLVVAWWCHRLTEPRRGEAEAVAARSRAHADEGDEASRGVEPATAEAESDAAALVTAAVTTPGVVLGTGLGGLLGRRWHGVVRGGRVVAGSGALVVGSLIAVPSLLAQSIVVQSGVLFLAATVMSIAIPNLQAAIADCLPAANQRGVGFSLLGIFTTFGAFGPMLVGVISDATGSLRVAFSGLLVPMVIGGTISMFARCSYEDDAERALDAAIGR